MRHGLKKILAFVLSVGLSVSAPALSHARIAPAAGPHEAHHVQNHADLSIDPEDGDCPHAMPTGAHDTGNGGCKKCCAACLGATLVPTTPVTDEILLGPSELLLARDDILAARAVPIDPGIPKPR